MKIAMIGATGRTGKWILETALARGHQVTALIRPPLDRLTPHPNLRIEEHDLEAPDTLQPPTSQRANNQLDRLARILSKHDAIVSTLNSAVAAEGTRHLIAAATQAGVQRYIALAGGGILQLDEQTLRRDRPGYPEVFRRSSEQHLKAWQALAKSPLNWTLVCTPDLTDETATGKAQAKADYMPAGANHVARGDVAAFMLEELERPRFERQRVGFTQTYTP